MSKEGLLQSELIELDVHGTDEAFEIAKEFARPYKWSENFRQVQGELMEAALKVVNSDATRQEKAEVIGLISTRDPIMWHLLCLHTHTNTNVEPPTLYLRKFIFTLIRHESKIRSEYLRIISPRRWNRPLKQEYRVFNNFINDNVPRDHFFGVVSLVSIISIFLLFMAFISNVS